MAKGGGAGGKRKLSKKVAKKYTVHRKYYSDTVQDYSSLNPFKRASKADKYAAISAKVHEQNQREKERQEKEEEEEIIQEIGSADVDSLYEVGPSAYDILVKSTQEKLKAKLKQLEEEEKKEKKLNKLNNNINNNNNNKNNKNNNNKSNKNNKLEDNEDDEDNEEEEEEEEEMNGEEHIEDQEEMNDEEVDDQDEEEMVDEEDEEEEEKDEFEDVYGKESEEEEEEEEEVEIKESELKNENKFESTTKLGYYNIHFNREISNQAELDELIKKSKSLENVSEEIEDIGVVTSIGCIDELAIDNQNSNLNNNNKKTQSKNQNNNNNNNNKSNLPKQKNTFHEYDIKKRLYKPWLKSKTKKENELYFTNLQKHLFPILNEYRDLLYTEESMKNHKSIFKLYALHAVNHILKSKDQLTEDNRIQTQCKQQKIQEPELKHQGFTKPKVLIVVPYRNTAFEIVRFILKLVPHELKESVEKKTKFNNEFTQLDKDVQVNENKPDDYKYTFRDNIDDCFRIGLSFRKGGLKLYSTFYHADIIITSPLGLRLVVGTEGDGQRDFDFLSSVEVLIIDQIETILQQNWDHIKILFENINKIPIKDHNIDFSRIRNSYLEGFSKNLRQTLLFSSILTPEINSIFNQNCHNIAGKIKIKKIKEGEVVNIVPSLRQTFHRLFLDSNDDTTIKFNFLIETIIPKFTQQGENNGILLFVSNYYEFVMIRNYFRKEAKSYVLCSEYTEPRAITRARSQFKEGVKTFMLFSERFHFFNRYNIRGIKHVIFFGLPQNPHFYSEILNMITENDGSIISLYTLKDKLALESIVGTNRFYKMIDSDKSTHLFSN